ncbi:MAG: outer membrane lipoprotein chaperone LolA [Pseudomonadota bacterium]|nr:outer membrane lipoprotein chaperone LolA [Pseudomonadota bacterium]
MLSIKKFFPFALIIFSSHFSLLAVADETANNAEDLVRSFLNSIQTYQADFRQQVFNESNKIVEEGSGEFWLNRPGKIKWRYDLPWSYEVVSDGLKVWMYDAELEQVTIRNAGLAVDSSPASLLAGEEDILNDYNFLKTDSSGYDLSPLSQKITLESKKANVDFEEITLVFRDDLIQQIAFSDRFGQRTEIQFTDIQFNHSVNSSVFAIDIPEGTDVIDESDL